MNIRRSSTQPQTTGATSDDGNLALQGKQGREVLELSFGHCIGLGVRKDERCNRQTTRIGTKEVDVIIPSPRGMYPLYRYRRSGSVPFPGVVELNSGGLY